MLNLTFVTVLLCYIKSSEFYSVFWRTIKKIHQVHFIFTEDELNEESARSKKNHKKKKKNKANKNVGKYPSSYYLIEI